MIFYAKIPNSWSGSKEMRLPLEVFFKTTIQTELIGIPTIDTALLVLKSSDSVSYGISERVMRMPGDSISIEAGSFYRVTVDLLQDPESDTPIPGEYALLVRSIAYQRNIDGKIVANEFEYRSNLVFEDGLWRALDL